MKILYLDDQDIRHERFTRYIVQLTDGHEHEIEHAFSAIEAILLLKDKMRDDEEYDLVSLDHDLGEADTGMDVVDFICKMPVDRRPREIRIHTANMGRGAEMVARLRDAGCSYVYQDYLKGY